MLDSRTEGRVHNDILYFLSFYLVSAVPMFVSLLASCHQIMQVELDLKKLSYVFKTYKH